MNLATKCWLIGGIAVSLLLYFAGRQSLSNRRAEAAILWQAVAVIIGLIVCDWAIVEKQWLSLVAAIAFVLLEVHSTRRSKVK